MLIWLGTCELIKKDADSKITIAPVDRFERVLHYEKFKAGILTFQRSADVYFIETPPVYISVWNGILGYKAEKGEDQVLYEKILASNERLKELNSLLSPPSISQDLCQSSKKKKKKKKKARKVK